MSLPSSVVTAVSFEQAPAMAAAELAQSLLQPEIGFVLFFCSADYDLPLLAAAMRDSFPETQLAGCTTAGEITPDGYGQGCITAIGFAKASFAIKGVLIRDMSEFSLLEAQSVVEQLMIRCRQRSIAPITGHTFALTLLDGLSVLEEQVLATLNAALGSIPHFGGSAADTLNLVNTHVYFDGSFHTNAAVLLLCNTRCDFKVVTTHHLQPATDKLVVTQSNRYERQVQELNAEPAAVAYANAIGVPVADLDHKTFALHPLAARLGDAHYVRSIQRVNPDLSLDFYCAVETGIVLTVMERDDIVVDTRLLLENIAQELGEIDLIIGCDCILRRKELELTGRLDAVSQMFRQFRVIGFNTYGEQYTGMHLNQTFTGVAIGPCR